MSGAYDKVKSKQLYDLADQDEPNEETALKLINDPMTDVNFTPSEGQYGSRKTSLYQAAWKGHWKIARALLQHPRIDVNQAANHGGTPLYAASFQGHEKVVRLLVEHPNININQETYDHWTPLWIASSHGHEKVVQLLLKHPKIDVNRPDNEDGWTPLYVAACEGNEKVVKLLMEHPNINVNQADNNGWTPLSAACRLGREKVVKMMLALNQPIEVLAIPKSGRDRAALTANTNDYPRIYELLGLFEPSDDPFETQARQAKICWILRKELGLNVIDAAKMLSLVVLLSDGYFRFQQTDDINQNADRFLRINLRLPLELQTRICNLAYERKAVTIATKDFDDGLKRMLK